MWRLSFVHIGVVFSAGVALTCGCFAGGALAQNAPVEVKLEAESDAVDRLYYAGRLPMLTQRVAAASCALSSDIEVEASHEILASYAEEFETIILALEHGNPDLHILSPEMDRRVVRDIRELWAEWLETRDAVQAVLKDGHDIDSAHVVDDHNLALLEISEKLVADISAEYSNPFELTQQDALAVRIAGRQRMLTQKMAKDACEIWTHYHEETAIPDLIASMDIFEKSMTALLDGVPAMGIRPAPTPEIREDLVRILDRWAVIRKNQDTLVNGGELSVEDRTEIFHDLNLELEELHVLVGHYRAHAERDH